ncbi:MAG: cytochrome C oxidase subunit IV family protein [Phycisphaerales bacterium]|nr:cytochrome C oxidase subunit IV family protein [Phycisphaerales bacterium]
MSQPAAHTANPAGLSWDPEDPHHNTQHSHHVISWQTLLLVLLALLFCTALTVGVYNLEAWIESSFEVHIPRWVNVFGAMSIAIVKAALVCAFFMQLRYDKALNTFALLFCLLGVGLFLTFSMIDLNTRDVVADFKSGEVVVGGTGVGLSTPARDERFDARVSPYVNTGGEDIVDFRREQGIANFFESEHGKHYAHDPAYAGDPEKAFWQYYYSTHGEHPHQHPGDTKDFFASLGFAHHDTVSTANKSIPRHGLTSGLFDEVGPAGHAGNAHGGAEHGDEDHEDAGH